jgi:hypothetical protein
MDSQSQGLVQQWKAWYKPIEKSDASAWNPLDKPVALNGRQQGGLPQKPRQVDLSKPKDFPDTEKPEMK